MLPAGLDGAMNLDLSTRTRPKQPKAFSIHNKQRNSEAKAGWRPRPQSENRQAHKGDESLQFGNKRPAGARRRFVFDSQGEAHGLCGKPRETALAEFECIQ